MAGSLEVGGERAVVTDVRLEAELRVNADVSHEDLRERLLAALDEEEGIEVDFACTTIVDR